MAANPLVVLGGGISGLSCAFYLDKLARNVIGERRIIVLEAAKRLGGLIKTERLPDGIIHELGPRSIRFESKYSQNTFALVDALGLSSEVIGRSGNDAAVSQRYIWADGQLNKLPSGLAGIFRKSPPIFKKSLVRYALTETFKPRLNVAEYEDITVYDFFKLRYDSNFADYLVDPLVRGICAGDARKLSMKAVFPDLFNYQDQAGSMVKGMLKKVQAPHHVHLPSEVSDVFIRAQTERWTTWNFVEGLQRLPEALCDYLVKRPNVQICNQSAVNSLAFNSEGAPVTIGVKTDTEEIMLDADYVISAVSAPQLAKLLERDPTQSSIAKKLNKIQGVAVGVVCVEYDGKDVVMPDMGFGFLVPSFEESKILGTTFDSCVFPAHDYGQNVTRLTVVEVLIKKCRVST